MWNDEDNNPYAFEGEPNPVLNPNHYNEPATPTSSHDPDEPPEFLSRSDHLPESGDEDEEEEEEPAAQRDQVPRRQGGYDSRIQQLLYEDPDLEIIITDAAKDHGGGGFIVYTIRTGEIEVRRRYSEFSSLRAALVNLHPTLIIPPIPEKHSMADYAAKPTRAKEDAGIIELRKRMLSVFLNRCRRMREVLEDGVWWRFLDPNSSWSEVLHSHPVASVPKNNLKAPPLDPANPTAGHNYLPVPSASAKLKSVGSVSSSGTPSSPPEHTTYASSAAHTIPGPQIFGRFPPPSQDLGEQDLDPYFINFEASTRELELLLQGSVEKVNRRTLEHLSKLSADLMELGARYNGFSLSEQSATVASAIERIGQAVDNTYIETEELSAALNANFAEPMRESAQFAGVVRNVLRYRILKRVQQEMTRDELEKKKALLDSLERSELEAKRLDAYLSGSIAPHSPPKRSVSNASTRSTSSTARDSGEDRESIDSDFPPTHGESPTSPRATQGTPERGVANSPTSPHKKSQSGNFVTNKIFGRISHAVHGLVDADPERSRRDQIGKTKESLVQLEQALDVSEKDVKDASLGILKDLQRFQKDKEKDIQRYMIAYAKCHIEWAKKNLETWSEAREEVDKIVTR
ncbi:putative sorting nexin-41 [Phaeomoniella chlamydospora]|uniref:Putative sorting nexin-41 n=1 Tax=Phaeomoniella chlamydospora TaxID=158046 RepID=A0A0G2GAZ8_PHACM|nr:putative sorting nexin-41 [Phaeomoniella chlamydospora]